MIKIKKKGKHILIDTTAFDRYQSKIICIVDNIVAWYDTYKDIFRAGIITEVEDDSMYIKAFDDNKEIAWPI